MPAITSCPESVTLQQLLRGEASGDAIESFAEHLAGCPRCAAAVESSLAGDTLAEAVRAQATQSDTPAPPAALLERLLRLGRPSAPGSTPDGQTFALPPSAAPAEALAFLAPPQAADEIGRLGGYRVLKVLGSGGMGLVFQAEDVHLKRKVALKVMKPEAAAKPGARERFLREAQAAAAVEHEHIVTIHHVGEENGVPFLAMQWLKGMSLEERLHKSGALKPAQVVRLGRQIALGLAAAHEQGLIHRDIKPPNLWLEPTHGGHIKVLDFGLARALADEVHLTQSGAILGTPSYMAPEQARGDKVDHRCDLFSLGVVLYSLATGRLPFRGASVMAILTSLAVDAPLPPRVLNAEVPAELSELIMQLLEKDPARRAASARAVAERLQRLGQPPVAPRAEPERTEELSAALATLAPAAAPLPALRPPRRRLRIAVAAGLAAAVLLATGAVFFLRTPNGTVRVEINDDSIEAVLTKNGAVIKGTDKAGDITVVAGPQTLTVRRGDLEFETHQFVLKKGDTVRLKVELLPGKVQVVQGERVIGEQALPVAGDPDRRAAEYVLSIGGTVRVNGAERDLRAAAELPKERFTLTRIVLNANPRVSDAGLAHFQGCKGLTHLDLGSTRVSDAGLAYFRDCKGLIGLSLDHTQVSDAGLAQFKDCTNLTRLGLSGTKVSDAGLAHLKDCKGLTGLDLHHTQVSDAGLAHFQGCTNLTRLGLSGTKVSDAGLAHFKNCKGLTHLSLGNTQVSDMGLVHFKNCEGLTVLDLYGTQVSDTGLAHFKDCKGLTHLYLDHTQVSDAVLAALKDCKALTHLGLDHTQVSDAGLAQFKGCKGLMQLDVRKTKVTAKALAEFHTAVPGCRIDHDAGVIEAKK